MDGLNNINIANEIPLVSIIIPVYNRENTIKRAIDSVLNQTYPNIEIVVVDDASEDNSVSVVKKYNDNRLKLICLPNNSGANYARNIGIKNSKGDFIAFQDSDDEWFPDKLMIQVDAMLKNNTMACYCGYFLHTGEDVIECPIDFYDEEKYNKQIKEILKSTNVVSTQTLVVRRTISTLTGSCFFDESMPRLQDYEYAIRLSKVTDIEYIPKLLVNVYRSENSLVRNHSVLYDAIVKMIKKHGEFLNVNEFLNTFLLKRDIVYDSPFDLLNGLDKIQSVIDQNVYSCKETMFAHMSNLLRIKKEICDKQNHNEIMSLENKKFSIYGAGNIGKKLYNKLKNKGILPLCFLVTYCDDVKYIDNIPIIALDDFENKDDMVVVAISEKNQIELINNLVERKFRHFCLYF